MVFTGKESNVWPQSRVLVTGGAGFIGSALVWELNGRGCTDVVVADFAAHAGKRGNLDSLKFTDYVEPSALLASASIECARKIRFRVSSGSVFVDDGDR